MIIGIDPGRQGGIASLPIHGAPMACSMPKTDYEVCRYIADTIMARTEENEDVYFFVEKVGGFRPKIKKKVCPNCGHATIEKTGQPGSRMYNFGHGRGVVVGNILTMAYTYSRQVAKGIHLEEVIPQTWQKAHGLGSSKGMSHTEWVRKKQNVAQKLFPMLTVTQQKADALLIMEYGRRIRAA